MPVIDKKNVTVIKKKRKMYFGQATEDAIIKYNKETDPMIFILFKCMSFH